MTADEVLRALQRDGWNVVRQTGSHRQLTHLMKPGTVTVPMYRNVTLSRKTLASIARQSGLTTDALKELT